MSSPSRNELSLEDILEELVAGLARDLKKLVYPRKYFDRVRQLETPAEKLIYLYVWLTQPQTFTSVRRGLNLGGKTVARALLKLKKGGLVVQDRDLLYWITEPETEENNS